MEFKTNLEQVEPPVNSAGERVRLKMKGTLQAFALKESDLAKFLGRSYLALNPGEEVEIANREALTLEMVSKDFDAETLTLRIKGRAHFVWSFDAEALKTDLVQAFRQKRREVFQNYPEIERAEIHFRPAWWRIFPQKHNRIIIEQTLRTQ